MIDRRRDALLVVDVQRDFCAGGALPVPNADLVVSPINRYIAEAVAHSVTVYASRDWHPSVSSHFKTYGGPWPPHCVKDTDGARFHPDLRLPAMAVVITKGEDFTSTGYSPFDGHTPAGKPFLTDLHERGIGRLYVGGIATDYCVKHSVLDALSAGLHVTVLDDAIAGVDPEDSRRVMAEMRRSGANVAAGPGLFVEHTVHG